MITEIVTFRIARDLDREAVVALYEQSAPAWQAEPDLIHNSYLYDGDTGTGGGVYLWRNLEAAKRAHGQAFVDRIAASFGSSPEFAYFETPVVVDNR
jgi:hypothetical protein